MGQQKQRLGKDHKKNKRVLDRFHRTCAISLDAPKTAALVFEKVVGTIDGIGDAPADIITYRNKGRIHGFPAMSAGGPEPEQRQVTIKVRDGFIVSSSPRENLLYLLNKDPDSLCAKISGTGHRPVLCYQRFNDDMEAFRSGDYGFIVSCIRNLDVVDEDRLSWEQVVEFRRDLEARALRTRFLYWLNEEMDGTSKAQIQDRIAHLYEQHDRVLRKFGIYTRAVGEAFFAVGKGSNWFSRGSLAALVAGTASGDPVLAALTTGIHLTRETWVGVRKAQASLKREHDAVAFIHGLTDRFGTADDADAEPRSAADSFTTK